MEYQSEECEAVLQKKRDLISLLDSLESENANKATIEFRMNNYLDYKAREKGVPLKGTFELTPLCNLDCKMCYVHLTKEQLCASGEELLTGERWKRIMQQAIDCGMLYALLTGGEAMLHPDFEDIYLFLQERGVNVSVNTNGLLLTEKWIEFFKRHRPKELRITLYGCNDEIYESVTQHRVFSQVLRAILQANEAKLPLRINITPSRYMRGGIEDTVRLLKQIGVPYGINSSLSEPRSETGRDKTEHDMTVEEYISLYRRLSIREKEVFQEVDIRDLPTPGGANPVPLMGLKCGAGRSSFSVLWNAKMQACLDFSEKQIDLTESSFAKAWQRINEFVHGYPIPQECNGCAYEKLCTVCVVKHLENASVGHANPNICKRAMKFVSRGIAKLE